MELGTKLTDPRYLTYPFAPTNAELFLLKFQYQNVILPSSSRGLATCIPPLRIEAPFSQNVSPANKYQNTALCWGNSLQCFLAPARVRDTYAGPSGAAQVTKLSAHTMGDRKSVV